MLGLRKNEREQSRNGEFGKDWFSYEFEDLVLKKKWIDTLYGKLKLDKRELLYLNELLQTSNMVDGSDNSFLKILVPFALSRKDEFICIQIPFQDSERKGAVQLLIRILDQ
ncbi:MAG: hypothetical protein ACE5J2_05490 [Nitrososphaerales archaeon]